MEELSIQLMQKFRDKYVSVGMTVLDVGSKNQNPKRQGTYRHLFNQYTGMDIVPGVNVDIVGYESLGIYDVVISGQVMEHVNHPWDWLKNLKKYFTEYICIIVPNRARIHRSPIDTYRYFPDGMRDLFNYAGIKELEIYAERSLTVGIGSHQTERNANG